MIVARSLTGFGAGLANVFLLSLVLHILQSLSQLSEQYTGLKSVDNSSVGTHWINTTLGCNIHWLKKKVDNSCIGTHIESSSHWVEAGLRFKVG